MVRLWITRLSFLCVVLFGGLFAVAGPGVVFADTASSPSTATGANNASTASNPALATSNLNDYPWNGLTSGGDGWGMGYGQCVSYAAWKIYEDYGGIQHPPTVPDRGWMPSDANRIPINFNWGNAGDWANSARSAGFAVDHTPKVGDIAQWNYGSDNGQFSVGHVAFVYQVNSDGSVELAQYNLREDEKFSTLHLPTTGATDTSNGHGPFHVSYPDNFIHFGIKLRHMSLTHETTQAPGLATFNGRLYVCWTGINGDMNLTSTSDGLSFGSTTTLSGASPMSGCSLAGFNGRLYLGFTDTSHDVTVYSSSNGTTFDCQDTVSSSGSSPALAVFNSKLYIAWTADSHTGTGALNLASTSTDCHSFGNTLTLGETAPANTSPALNAWGGYLWLAWKGIDPAGSLNVSHSSNGTSFTKQTLKETSPYGPALTHAASYLVIGWTGSDTNHHLNTIATSGTSFTEANHITYSDTANQAPGLASFNSYLDIAWKGTDSSSHLYVGFQA